MSTSETKGRRNGPLIALVTAVAVVAVSVGGALASRQNSAAKTIGSAAPLSRGTSPATPSGTPSSTPSTQASRPVVVAPPTSAVSRTSQPPPQASTTQTQPTALPPTRLPGPVKSKVDAAKLDKGRNPQLPYLQGRQVSGGAGQPATIPGTTAIQAVGRVGDLTLALVDKEQTAELLTLQHGKVIRRTPDVTGMVTTPDHRAGAYLSDPEDRGNGDRFPVELAGGTLYAVTAETSTPKQLELTGRWNIKLLSYAGGKVYFRSSASDNGAPQLFTWTPGRSKADLVKSVPYPTAISPDGKLAAGLAEAFVEDACYQLYEIATGKRLWRSCEYAVHGFTPDGKIALAGFSSGVSGHGDGKVAALDTRTGNVLREWELTSLGSVAEDDGSILILNDPAPGTGDRNAIVRCSVPTGRCELATGFTVPPKLIGQ